MEGKNQRFQFASWRARGDSNTLIAASARGVNLRSNSK
jgi:hypothetical protein